MAACTCGTVTVMRSTLPGATSVQLVVTDLDGTLSDADERVHPRTLAALERLREDGVPVLVATGRRARSAARVLAAHDLRLPAVLLDGALGRDLPGGGTWHRVTFPPGPARAALAACQSVGLGPAVLLDRADDEIAVGADPACHPGYLEDNRQWLRVADLAQVVETEPVLAFSLIGLADPGPLQAIAAALDGTASAPVSRELIYGGWSLQVSPLGVNKWRGVVAFCARQGLDPSRVLAVGDGANDAELLAAAAVACAISGGHPSAVGLADHLLDPPDRGGWADVLELL